MQVSVESTSDLERKLTFGIPADAIDGESQKRLQQLSRNVRLNGFRPGKVPFKVVKKRFGLSVRQEVIGELMQQYFYQALSQEKLTPAGMPQIEPKADTEGQDVEFVATFEVFPDVTLQSMADVTIKRPIAEVKDEDLTDMIDTLLGQRATWVEVKRKSKAGDQVVIDFVGKIDDEEFEGGSATDHALELGSNSMIPGFEDQLIDAKAGDEVSVEVTFPEDYQAEALQGKAAVFTTTVKAVNKKQLPKMGELAEQLGIEDGDVTAMKADVRSNMERELETATQTRIKNQVMDALLQAHEFEVPMAAIDGEIDALRKQTAAQYGNEAMADQLPAEMFKDQATRRVKLGILIGSVINAKELQADAEKVDEQLQTMAAVYEQPEEVIQYYKAEPQRMQQMEQIVLEQMVVDSLLDEAKVEDETMTFKEVMNQKDAAAE